METKLHSIVESDSFLNRISNISVDQIKGQAIDVGDSGLLTGRVKSGRFMGSLPRAKRQYLRANRNGLRRSYQLDYDDNLGELGWQRSVDEADEQRHHA